VSDKLIQIIIIVDYRIQKLICMWLMVGNLTMVLFGVGVFSLQFHGVVLVIAGISIELFKVISIVR
jgi:hypothetical protein